MTITRGRVLDRLPAEEACLGAVFTSYTFDPEFFEDHVLRAVLRLASDPVEQAARYHGEARRALQETPVTVIVDAGVRQPGRRLPYDLLEVSQVVFHPKSALLLYARCARLMVGSGNLTFAGYGGNTELFLSLDLDYDQPSDVALLRAFDAHLDRLHQLTRRAGGQLSLFRAELDRRLAAIALADQPPAVALLDSTEAPILDQLAGLLPEDAVVERLGLLGPFFERDDGAELDATSVFGALRQRAAKDIVLDVGVAWDNPQVYAPPERKLLPEGLGKLWAWAYEDGGERAIEHLTPTSLGRQVLQYIDQHGQVRRWPLEEALAAVEDGDCWMLPPPIAFAPQRTLEAANTAFAEVNLWLHPATRLVEGRPLHRPLHAKLFLLTFRSGTARRTLVLMGSANMSRRALLLTAGPQQGNVELGLAFQLEGVHTLTDFLPELVYAPATALQVQEREFPELGRNYALAIDEAVHDPARGTLQVSWRSESQDLPPWRLTYHGRELASSATPPTAPLLFENFVLHPASAEVVLHVEGREFTAPILVTDLVALPVTIVGSGLGLDELLMLLGRRIGAERAEQIARGRAERGEEDEGLAAFFGEGFGPTDVFQAWWAVAEELQDPTLSVLAFRLRLEGALGVGAAWERMREAMEAGGSLQPAEVWIYGAELLRTLSAVELPAGVEQPAKCELLAAFRRRIQTDLAGIPLDAQDRPWVKRIQDFYAGASS